MKRLKEKYRALKEKWHAFRVWQQQPHQVAPMSEEHHECTTCGTHYQGNYCPRCGQSAKIGRYSFKKAFLLFLDVWGLGNRGMFRTIRDLLLRPGYMIRDYLKGMQMAYFPPFKMFFLLIALSLLVESGFNILGKNQIAQTSFDLERGLNEAKLSINQKDTNETPAVTLDKPGTSAAAVAQNDSSAAETVAPPKEGGEEEARVDEISKEEISIESWAYTMQLLKNAFDWYNNNQTIIMLALLFIISGPLYLAFRHSPNIPDMKFSEFFVAIVYTTNMITIYSVVISFFCLNEFLATLATLLAIPSLKQLSGYSYLSTSLRAISVFTITSFVITVLVIVAAIAVGFFIVLQNQ